MNLCKVNYLSWSWTLKTSQVRKGGLPRLHSNSFQARNLISLTARDSFGRTAKRFRSQPNVAEGYVGLCLIISRNPDRVAATLSGLRQMM